MADRRINRRKFFILGTSTLGAVYLSQCALGQSSFPPLKTQPSVQRSKAGFLEIFLDAGYGAVNLAGRQAYLFNYNGQMPGPRIEAHAGDTVRIHLTNSLNQLTNLHYHGLHVSPRGNADNFFLEIPAGETFTYELILPENHPAGTFWYHPHIHGLTAEQIFGGLAGLFIVRGKLDEIPEIQAAKEEFLVLQDFALASDGQMLTPNPMSQMMAGREGLLVTANGKVNPSLSIPSGGLLRLRLLNASASRFYRLVLEDHPLYQIATDGGALAEPVEQKELLLVPGERAEVLIKGDRPPGQYRLLNLPYDRGGMGMMNGMGMMGGSGMMGGNGMMGGGRRGGQQPIPQETRTLATLSYQGTVQPLPLPTQLLPIITLPPPQRVRQFTLNAAPMTFTINGKTFDPDRVDTRVSLNTVEDWEIANPRTMMSMDHPFHLHTNSFQVISRNGMPENFLAWRDMILVRPGEVVRLRIPFRDFSGKTIYHCHISDHGDRGMMGVIEMEE